MKEKNTTRVQMDMRESGIRMLRALKEKTGASSYAEVVRNALRLYDNLVDEEGEIVEYRIVRSNPHGK